MTGTKKTLTAFKMAKRIFDNTDNIYNKKVINRQVITDILKLYMDECRKALLKGERIEVTGVGTIVPEAKVHIGNYNLPMCNKDGGNPPFTKLRITRTESLRKAMNKALTENIENGIYGLEELPFSKQQLKILKDSGYILEDTETEEDA
jgi:hypothetical protein